MKKDKKDIRTIMQIRVYSYLVYVLAIIGVYNLVNANILMALFAPCVGTSILLYVRSKKAMLREDQSFIRHKSQPDVQILRGIRGD